MTNVSRHIDRRRRLLQESQGELYGPSIIDRHTRMLRELTRRRKIRELYWALMMDPRWGQHDLQYRVYVVLNLVKTQRALHKRPDADAGPDL